MAKDDEKRKRGGCLGKLLGLFVFATIVGLGVALYFVGQPQDLADLEGAPALGGAERDLREVLEKAIEGNYSVRISEGELNRWLGSQLALEQGGGLGANVSLQRVWVRLEEGVAEVVFVRDVAGHALTTSIFLQVEQAETAKGMRTSVHLHGGGYHDLLPVPSRGGRFGQLTVPQGFLNLVMPDFKKLAEVFAREIELGFEQMSRIKIEEGGLLLDPMLPEREVQGGGGSAF